MSTVHLKVSGNAEAFYIYYQLYMCIVAYSVITRKNHNALLPLGVHGHTNTHRHTQDSNMGISHVPIQVKSCQRRCRITFDRLRASLPRVYCKINPQRPRLTRKHSINFSLAYSQFYIISCRVVQLQSIANKTHYP